MTTINDSFELAKACAQLALSRKADDIRILDLSEIESSPADYFVICTAGSEVQMRAIRDAVTKGTAALGSVKPRTEGEDGVQWMLLDYFDVVVHIFSADGRTFYKLEKLWGDAPVYLVDDKGGVALQEAAVARQANA